MALCYKLTFNIPDLQVLPDGHKLHQHSAPPESEVNFDSFVYLNILLYLVVLVYLLHCCTVCKFLSEETLTCCVSGFFSFIDSIFNRIQPFQLVKI